jgi:peptidoglycan glycosyltransferase
VQGLLRVAVWALVPTVVLGMGTSFLARTSEARLQLARERLLAGRPEESQRALRGVRWPTLGATARAASALAGALAGTAAPAAATAEADSTPTLADMEALGAEAVLVGALDRGDVDGAGRLASLLRRCGDPLGALYAAAFAFDRGSEDEARREAAALKAPLASRGPGRRLAAALAARERGARTLLWDRGGRLVAVVDEDGSPRLTTDGAGVLDEALARLADGADTLPREAASVRLTLDAELSHAALEALGGWRGSIVLLEPRTGALLAAVSDPATTASEPMAAFSQRREPASIAKVLTAAAAYRAGHDADAEIKRMTCGGVERYGGKPLWCAFPAGPLEGLDHALEVSCNIAFANLAVLVGRERLLDEYRLWGFDGRPGALLGAAGRVHAGVRSPRDLADLGIGLEHVDVTPLHAAALAAVIGDEGRMPAVHLVAGATSPLGLRDAPRRLAAPTDILPSAIAARLREAMAAVARHGTGAGLAPPGFAMAMKTGTAATPGLGYHVNYIGTAPLPDPTVAFAVRVTGEGSSPAVTQAAREVTRRLLAALAARAPRLAADARRQRSGVRS